MKQKNYTKPTTMVVKLQQPHLMVESQQDVRGAGVRNYKWNNIEEEE